MNKREIEEIKNIFNSIICLAVEGVEVIRPMVVIDKIAKEAEKGYDLVGRHLTSQSSGQENAEPKFDALAETIRKSDPFAV